MKSSSCWENVGNSVSTQASWMSKEVRKDEALFAAGGLVCSVVGSSACVRGWLVFIT